MGDWVERDEGKRPRALPRRLANLEPAVVALTVAAAASESNRHRIGAGADWETESNRRNPLGGGIGPEPTQPTLGHPSLSLPSPPPTAAVGRGEGARGNGSFGERAPPRANARRPQAVPYYAKAGGLAAAAAGTSDGERERERVGVAHSSDVTESE